MDGMRMKAPHALLLAALVLAAAGCGAEPELPAVKVDDNLILDIGNISPAMTEVDLAILIDGKPAASGTFKSEFPASPRTTCGFRLAEGSHTLTVVSEEAGTTQHSKFEVGPARQWCSLTFDYSPGGKLGSKIPAAVEIRFANKPFRYV